ncbi:hypothetical protein FY046_01750 [Erwinia sp. 1181_3]|uniref:hypothetical protein n=1 Tax=Erwinia sp. 1181_3 TaxID=2605957 RepID=UPI0040589BD9
MSKVAKPFDLKAADNSEYRDLLDACISANFDYQSKEAVINRIFKGYEAEAIEHFLQVSKNLESIALVFKQQMDEQKKNAILTEVEGFTEASRKALIEEFIAKGYLPSTVTAQATTPTRKPRTDTIDEVRIGGQVYQVHGGGLGKLNKYMYKGDHQLSDAEITKLFADNNITYAINIHRADKLAFIEEFKVS